MPEPGAPRLGERPFPRCAGGTKGGGGTARAREAGRGTAGRQSHADKGRGEERRERRFVWLPASPQRGSREPSLEEGGGAAPLCLNGQAPLLRRPRGRFSPLRPVLGPQAGSPRPSARFSPSGRPPHAGPLRGLLPSPQGGSRQRPLPPP